MKCNILFLMCVALVAGCSFEQRPVQSFIENPPKVLRDPAFTEYQEQMEALESRHLAGEISYAEYVAEQKEIQEGYDRQVRHRDAIIQGE
ncbi:MAG TPA: hypothetical protein P5246_05740 [Candidatus Omnitrophota bacterium]|nr:hypothetical protein [Candidatus Omnitrophota bacterium]HSA30298.1 hypothetical protein [Candidatus Omnitrophota bacterium]